MNIIRCQRHMDRPLATLDDVFSDLFDGFAGHAFRRNGGDWIPALDVARLDDSVVVKVEVPGLKSEDIELTVENNVLSISGVRRAECEETRDAYYHVERGFGSFRRRISLPADVDSEKVTADCKDGVLTVTLPKTERAKARKIEVKGE